MAPFGIFMPAFGMLMIIITSSYGQSCRVDEINVQPNFELKRLEGRWYEIMWSSFKFEPVEYRYRDYVNVFQYLPFSGRINVNGTFRRPEKSSRCFYYDGILEKTETPGKLKYTSPTSLENPVPSETSTKPFWIISTDYANYLVTYACGKIFANGTCDKSSVKSIVWGRSPMLSPESKAKVDEALKRICMKEDSYLATTHDDECEIVKSTAWTHSKGLSLITALVTLVFGIML